MLDTTIVCERVARSMRILDVKIDVGPLETRIDRALGAVDGRCRPIRLACVNPHSIVVAQKDPEFLAALEMATETVPDGVGVMLGAKLLGADAGERITGHDYFHNLMARLDEKGGALVFFFGSTESVLEAISRRVGELYPHIEIAGTLSPPFGEWSEKEDLRMIDAINDRAPDVLWVGMTAPKQEKWVARNQGRLRARVIGSIGAVFDFVAETHPRAPVWMREMGLEWLYRLAREPRRMWRRNLVSTPAFLAMVIRRRLFG